MSSRLRFCELLTSLCNLPINENDFDISSPLIIDGIKTSVMVRPRNKTRRYGFQQIEYQRFDLSIRPPLVIDWRGEQNTHQLIKRVELLSHFPYRLAETFGSVKTVPRKLRLLQEDIVNSPIRIMTNLTPITLQANDTSDFFIGSWNITLRRTI